MSDLERFLADEAVISSGRRDRRVDVLRGVAGVERLRPRPAQGSRRSAPRPTVATPPVASLKRGVRSRNGELVAAESLLPRIAAAEERLRNLRRRVSETFFLSRWAADHGVEAPETSHERFRRRGYARTSTGSWRLAGGRLA